MKKMLIRCQLILFGVIVIFSTQAQDVSKSEETLTAKPYYSGYELAHDTYNAISTASDGKIYYVLSAAPIDEAGKVYVFDPATEKNKISGRFK